jgi:ferric-dicitrate binding protein FerR (iron transport regulator)
VSANTRGRFRTRGRHSSATVRGTKWEMTDRCDGTLTTVARGKVAVRDFRRKKTIIVKTGKRYLAKAPR